VTAWLFGVAAAGLAAAALLRFLGRRRDHRAGQIEADRNAAVRELAHAGRRRRIEESVARLDDAAVADELHRRHARD